MLNNVSYFLIFGKPLMMYLGITTLACFLAAASVPIINKKTKFAIAFIWHIRIAKIAIALAILHGLLGVLSYF